MEGVTIEEYVAARYVSLRRLAFLLCGDWAEAEDLVQTALVRCERRWSRISGDDPHAYVRRSVINAAHSWRRRQRPSVGLPESLAAPDAGSDSRVALVQALRGLPVQQREVLVLRYFEQLSEAEIAVQLGVPTGTVKSRAARGIATLRSSSLLEGVDA
jgi:RNA polymerase sigma-70 factor (sigma-E family)